MHRRFVLIRDVDPNGISGTGLVTEGVRFRDGVCAMHWVSAHRSTCVYDSVEDLLAIHGHEGNTRILWLDEAEDEDDEATYDPMTEKWRQLMGEALR